MKIHVSILFVAAVFRFQEGLSSSSDICQERTLTQPYLAVTVTATLIFFYFTLGLAPQVSQAMIELKGFSLGGRVMSGEPGAFALVCPR